MSDLRFGRSETNIRMVRTFELFSAQIITYYMCVYIYVCTLIECSLKRILVVWYPTPSLSFSERLPVLTTGTTCADPEIFMRGGPTKMVIFDHRRGGVQPPKNPEIYLFLGKIFKFQGGSGPPVPPSGSAHEPG